MLTDPVSDYLTRVRNALGAGHDERRGSRLAAEDGDEPHPRRAGLHRGLRGRADPRRRGDPDPPPVHRRPPAGDHRHRARLAARAAAATSSSDEVPRVQGGMGTAIISTSSGVMTGHEAKHEGRRRRGRRLRLVTPDEPHRQTSPSTLPDGVTVDVAPGRVTVNGPKGELAADREPRHGASSSTTASSPSPRPTDRGAAPRPARADPLLVANMVEGVTEGFERGSRSRASATAPACRAATLELSRRLLAHGHRRGARRDRVRGPAADPGDRPRHRQAARRRDRRADPPRPPARALQGQGHPLRRRAGAQEGRQASDDRQDEAPGQRCAVAGACGRRSAATRERPRLSVFRSNRGISAQLIDDDRGATVAAVAWTEPEIRKLELGRRREEGGRAARRRGPRTRASRPASSTVAATATTAACARSPTALARAA